MINVVIALPSYNIGAENEKKIRGVSTRINLQDATSWVREERAGNLSHEKELNAMLGGAEVLLATFLPRNLIKRAPKLKWIQMSFVGMEGIVRDKDLIESSVKLTNTSGVQADAIGEYVITLMLAFDKHLPAFSEMKKRKNWKPITMVGFASQTVGILGLGSIGRVYCKKSRGIGDARDCL